MHIFRVIAGWLSHHSEYTDNGKLKKSTSAESYICFIPIKIFHSHFCERLTDVSTFSVIDQGDFLNFHITEYPIFKLPSAITSHTRILDSKCGMAYIFPSLVVGKDTVLGCYCRTGNDE